MSPTKVYISRNFTEFGPFTQEEVLDFSKRGIIGKKDFVRVHNADEWVHTDEWTKKAGATDVKTPVNTVSKPAAAATPAPAKKAAKAAKKVAAKKAPAKKAAK